MKVSSWLALGCGASLAILAIGAVFLFKSYFGLAYVAPTVLALAGIPIVALSIVRSEAIRGLGWVALAWVPPQLGQPLFFLAMTIILFVVMRLTALTAVAASIFAYAATLILQWGALHVRMGGSRRGEPKIQLRSWFKVALSFLWISMATLIFLQAGTILVGLFLKPQDVAIYSAATSIAGFVPLPTYAATALGAPKFAALHAKDRQAELQALFTITNRWTFWPSLVIALIYAIFGSMVLRLFGPGFEQGYPALLILTLRITLGRLCRTGGEPSDHDGASGDNGPSTNDLRNTGRFTRTRLHSGLGDSRQRASICGGDGADERVLDTLCCSQARNIFIA